jgi:hydrogenase expression/formation protein HypC
MCLGELGQVLEVSGGTARVRIDDRLRTASLLTLDDPVTVGDWVLVHSGFALAKLSEQDARDAETIRSTPQEGPP